MEDRKRRCSRRKFLAQAAALTLGSGLPQAGSAKAADTATTFRARPPRVSADGRKPTAGLLIEGYPLAGRFHVPRHYVSAMVVDQTPENDLSRPLSRDYNFRITRSIAEALTNGSNKLAVDGVLLIGEHGNYPRNDKGQILYPRYEMMEQIVAVFRKTGQSVPVFNDKHLSYSWARAREIFGWAQELKFPLMAGSSLPVT